MGILAVKYYFNFSLQRFYYLSTTLSLISLLLNGSFKMVLAWVELELGVCSRKLEFKKYS